MKAVNFKEVQAANEKLQAIDPAFLSASPELCKQTAIWCATIKAFTSEQMAIAKKDWNDAKAKAYENYIFNEQSRQSMIDKYGIMAMKDYINAKCADFESRYLYIERTNNAAGAMEDILITCISYEKQMLYANGHTT